MSGPQTRDISGADDPDGAARFLLGCLVARHPTLLSIDELVREFAGSSREHQTARLLIDDGVAQLLRSGLAHQLDGFVFASQAAIRASQLAV